MPLLYWMGRAELALGDAKQAVEPSRAGARARSETITDPVAARDRVPAAWRCRARRVDRPHAAAKESRSPTILLLELLDQILESSRGYEARAQQALNAGKLADAVSFYRTAGELAPADASPREHLGTTLFLAGDLAGARAAFEDAIRVAPRFARAHYSLALLLDSMRDRAGSLRELTIAVEDDPTYVDAHLALGDMLRRARRFDDALDAVPKRAPARSRLLDRRARTGDGLGRRDPVSRSASGPSNAHQRRSRASPSWCTRGRVCSRPRPTPASATDNGHSR